MTTIYDIAKRVGLHEGTVSRVLSGRGRVRPATAARVQRACRELNYHPSAFAQSLRTGKTQTVCVFFPYPRELVFSNPFFPEYINGVSFETVRNGYSLTFSFQVADREVNLAEMVTRQQADGVILSRPLRSDPRIEEMRREDIPCVLGRYEGRLGPRMACVDIDNRNLGYKAGRYLLSRGHRRIGLLTDELENMTAADIAVGFRQAVSEAGLEQPAELCRHSTMTYEDRRKDTRELLGLSEPPTAIFVSGRLVTMTVMDEVRVMGKQVEVLGYRSLLGQDFYRRMTTIHVPMVELGEVTAKTLIEILRTGEKPASPILLEAHVVDSDDRVIM